MALACRRRWALVLYAPAFALPLAARLLLLSRDAAALSLASVLKGACFGCIQDAAVLLQTLVLARLVLAARDAVVSASPAPATRAIAQLCTAFLLGVAYAWMTLACLVDLSLLLRFLPRLNRGFVQMYLEFSGQFASSMEEALTPGAVFGFTLYAASMVLWVVAILTEKASLPRFDIPFCHVAAPASPSPRKAKSSRAAATSSLSAAGLFPWMLHVTLTSVALRTVFLALLVLVSALHATVSLDGNGNDIYLMSNAMFSLEMEGFLRPPARAHAAVMVKRHRLGGPSSLSKSRASAAKTNATATSMSPVTTAAAAGNVTSYSDLSTPDAPTQEAAVVEQEQTEEFETQDVSPFYQRTIGVNELFDADEETSDKYPFWRTTRGYTGPRRFKWKTPSKSAPPTVFLINLESFRSREVGVLGGREKKALYNQTVTPFFDSLSASGVLFRQHYTPCVQTSRTLLSTLFGILPSMADAAAVATFKKTQLRLHGLPQILKRALNYTTTFWSAVNLAWEDWRGFFLANGFDSLVDDTEVLKYLTKKRRDGLTDDDAFSWGRHDSVSLDALERFLSQRQKQEIKQPLFLDVYTVSSHDPWKIPANFTPSTNYSTYLTADNAKYVHSLNYVDQCLEKFFRKLRRKSLLNNTIFLIEGDHGYGRMEHGNNPTIVASYVYEEGTHVPMLLLADDFLDESARGMVVDELTSQTDMLATITDLLGIEDFHQHGIGQSMARRQRGELERAVVLSNPFYGGTKGLRVGPDMKYARYGSGLYEVFNLTSDPLEKAPVETGKHSDFRNNVTAEEFRFLEEVMEVAQFMYDTNGFMPPKSEIAELPAPTAAAQAATPTPAVTDAVLAATPTVTPIALQATTAPKTMLTSSPAPAVESSAPALEEQAPPGIPEEEDAETRFRLKKAEAELRMKQMMDIVNQAMHAATPQAAATGTDAQPTVASV